MNGFGWRNWAQLGVIGMWALGCAPQKPASSGAAAHCPAGQTFDGQFCRVDQTVATVEEPVPEVAPSETSQPAAQEVAPAPGSEQPEAPADTTTAEPKENQSVAEITPVQEQDTFVAPPAAAPVDYAMAAQAAPVMQYFAGSHLPAGARPLGAPFAGQFRKEQALTKKVQLTAGKCYTIVGMGLPPVTEVDLLLVDPADNHILARDETTGPQAALGSRDNCHVAGQTGSFLVVLLVHQGQGVAAAQVFQK